MKITTLLIATLSLTPLGILGADSALKDSIEAAARKLAEQPSFTWQTTAQLSGLPGPFPGANGGVRGQMEKDGFTFVQPVAGPGVEFAKRGPNAAVYFDENWMTLSQATTRPAGDGGGRFNSGAVTNFKLPFVEAEELAGKVADFRKANGSIVGDLPTQVVNDLLGATGPGGGNRGRGGRGGRGGNIGALKDPKGSVEFSIQNGLLTQFKVTVSGTRDLFGNEVKLAREITTRVTAIGSTKVALPADAKEILDALAENRTPNVFVPEPGFKKLFNGHDLTGWAGRPEHWSVQDGAIVGKTTADHPARGNNFLIARSGGKNLIVDDFELRFSYRLSADNQSGFANSGMQYRSKELPNFVVAGYQGDFEAGTTFSGILYDEAGGAGGRGVMAERGQRVVWSPDGKKTVTGQLGKSEEIQAKIHRDDWNDYTIIAQGNHLQHFINGVKTVDVIDDASARLTSGILALQLHAGEPMTVYCKNIRIKSLSTPDVVGGSNVKIAKDFKLEVLYTVPKESEGSWVAMCFDPKGRLIVSDQNGALHRVTLPATGMGGLVQTERIALEIGGAHGLLYAFDSLYVSVNEGSRPHGLYRVRDTDGDDKFDKVELLRPLQAAGEHGAHSLILSPDGKSIYIAVGNQSTMTTMDSSRAPMNWSEDELLPRLPTGFMDNSYAPQGWIARTDPDGKQWELMAMGMRNEFDIAFNKVGELFTYDADMEWDIGDPWYRPTRINHVISGAEFGFRNGNGKWPDYYIDSFGAVVNIGPGSPTGITFGYGAKFPAKYQDALFIADWSFGKLRAVHLRPEGASYTAEVEEFLSGQPLPVTDVLINPHDGAMYFAVGGRGTQSALYRVTYVGSESTAPSSPDRRFQAQRDLRHRLESFHGRKDAKAVETVWPYLNDSDRSIRFAARIALEWQDVSEWRERALSEKDSRKAIAALVALIRCSAKDHIHRKESDPTPDPGLRSRILSALGGIDWSRLSLSDRIDLLRAYSLAFIRLGRPDEAARQQLIGRFDPLFPAKKPELDGLLAQTLAYLEAPSAAAKIVAALRVAPTQEEQIDFALDLRVLKSGWTPELRDEYFRWFLTAESYRGGNTFASSLRAVKNGALSLLTDEEKQALKPVLEARSTRKSPRDLLATRNYVNSWTVNELVPVVERGLKNGRNYERGRKLYGDVACAACHRFNQEGGSVGPDLSGVVGRFSIRDLLDSIVEPSKVISDQYEAIVIRKKDGETVTGRIGNLSGANVNVVEDMFDPGRMTGVRRADIQSMEPSRISMMPEGLLNTLKDDEIQDLVAYLLSRGDPQSPYFR